MIAVRTGILLDTTSLLPPTHTVRPNLSYDSLHYLNLHGTQRSLLFHEILGQRYPYLKMTHVQEQSLHFHSLLMASILPLPASLAYSSGPR